MTYYEKYAKYKTKYLNLKGASLENTYLIMTHFLDYDKIKPLIDKRGNWREYDSKSDGNTVTFCYADGDNFGSDKYTKINSVIKNTIDNNSSQITVKKLLHKNFQQQYPQQHNKYMMPYYVISLDNYKTINKNIFDNIWIIKRAKSSEGIGNKVLTSYEDFINYIDAEPQLYKKYGWLLEKYIGNPLLYKGYKFHLRMYFLYYNKQGYLFNYGLIVRANKPYQQGDYKEQDIHDTHAMGKKFITFPIKFIKQFGQNNTDKVFDQIKDVSRYLLNILNSYNAKCYPETKHCYQIFGHDIMVMPDFSIKILETNEYPGIPNNETQEKYFEGILNLVVDKIVPPVNQIEATKDWFNVLN